MADDTPPPTARRPGPPGALQKVRQNTAYLINPSASPAPERRRIRVLLRTTRYVLLFVFWRLVRYAKYAAVGAITAAVAGTAVGSAATGIGFILAPPGILAGAGVGLVWGLSKFGWRTLARRVRSGDLREADAREDEHTDHDKVKEVVEVPRLKVGGPRVDVW